MKASFLSSVSDFFIGHIASADIGTNANTVTPPPPGDSQNLQNLSILSANVSPLSGTSSSDNQTDTDTDINIADNNAIIPAVGPTGVSDGSTPSPDSSSNQTSVYVVRSGDSIGQIAQMFGVSVDTILWANNMKKGDTIKEGDVLLILPVSGIEYTVKKGDTIQSIAKDQKVDVNDILQNNDITLNTPLNTGDTLIIPNGSESQSSEGNTPVPNTKATTTKDKLYYEQHPVQNLAGYYIDPVPGYRLSQGIHDNNAVDLAISPGTPIHAAASGTVLLARYGYNGGFGNVVIINHPNGTQTLYAHQSKLATTAGAQVSQGQVIGYVGSTGHSTGPHLHFEVHGAQNPGATDSWKPWNY